MQWLTLQQVEKKTALGKTTLYKLMSEQGFPRPIRPKGLDGDKGNRWIESEVDAWMQASASDWRQREPHK